MKKSLGLITAGLLAFSTVGVLAFTFDNVETPKKAEATQAAYRDKLFVGDHEMQFGETINDGSGGTATYTQGTGSNPHTLTLTNFNYAGPGLRSVSDGSVNYIGIAYGKDQNINVVVNGENSIVLDNSADANIFNGVEIEPEHTSVNRFVKFTGTGKLRVKAPDSSTCNHSYGGTFRTRFINESAILEFEGGTEIIDDTGLRLVGGADINGGSVKGVGNGTGISWSMDSYTDDPKTAFAYTITGGTLSAISRGNSPVAVGLAISLKNNRDFNMTGGTLNAISPLEIEDSCGMRIYNNTGYTYLKGGNVNVEGYYGVYRLSTNYSTYPKTYLDISDDVTFVAQGSEQALKCKVKNAVPGVGYPEVASGGEKTVIPSTTDLVDYETSTYKTVRFGKEEATYITRPTAKSLVYNGEEQFLVNDGEAENGEIVYRLQGEEDFTYDVPKATEVGTYVVEYKIEADPGYKDTEISTLTVTISEKPAPGPTPTPSGSSKAGLPAGAVVGIVLGSLVLALCGAYFLLLFVFNKWIRVGDKALRVFPFALGSRDGKKRLFVFPFKFEYRVENEIFKTKDEALK